MFREWSHLGDQRFPDGLILGLPAQLDGQPSIMSMRGWALAENDIETVVAVTRIRTQGNILARGQTPVSRQYRCGQEGGSFCQCAVLGFGLPQNRPGFVRPGNPEVAIRTPTCLQTQCLWHRCGFVLELHLFAVSNKVSKLLRYAFQASCIACCGDHLVEPVMRLA